jgi:predicted Rossmann fold nucleotide-binding protein DprA/Smf involved in DNA uptake
MANYPEAVYWLTLINESGLKLNLIKPIIQRWSIMEGRPLADLFGLSALEWSTNFGLSDEEATQAVAAQEKLAQQAATLAGWQGQGLELLTRTDRRYPKRLTHTLSPVAQPLLLWVKGNVALLNQPTVVMLGKEAPDAATSEFLDELMQALVGEDIGLVSGYGRGLDRTTFETMLNTTDGRAVVMLPMGLSAFAKTTSKLEAAVASGQIALVSPFAPDTPYQERLAEARTLLIDHLALAILILETNEEAQGRAEEALNRGQPVFVSLTDTASNRELINQGALLLTDAGEVVEMVQQAIIDAALLESDDNDEVIDPVGAAPIGAVRPIIERDANDDYSLRAEEIEPIDSEEALEILSLGGEIPELLRKRLQNRSQEDQEK